MEQWFGNSWWRFLTDGTPSPSIYIAAPPGAGSFASSASLPPSLSATVARGRLHRRDSDNAKAHARDLRFSRGKPLED